LPSPIDCLLSFHYFLRFHFSPLFISFTFHAADATPRQATKGNLQEEAERMNAAASVMRDAEYRSGAAAASRRYACCAFARPGEAIIAYATLRTADSLRRRAPPSCCTRLPPIREPSAMPAY
jgi:hypothetical protein